MFTLAIDGRAVAITDADEEQARELFDSEEFKNDLKTMTEGGEPLWNGTASFTVRRSTDEEIDSYDDAMSDDEDEPEDDDEEDGINVLFLVAIDTDDDEDEATS